MGCNPISQISSLLGGSGSQSSNPSSGQYYNGGVGTAPVYQFSNQPGADSSYLNNVSELQGNNLAANELQNYEALNGQILANPQQQMLQNAASSAGAASGTVGNQDLSTSANLAGLATSMIPYSSQILNTAFDPQNALYNRTAQQVTDATRAANEARGIDMSATGAGLENQALSNFNIDWQNNQLGRETSGLSAADTNNSTIGSNYTTAGNLGNSGVESLLNVGAIPYASQQQIYSDKENALNNISTAGANANVVPQQAANDYLSYLNSARGNSQAANSAAGTGFNNLSSTASGLGGLASSLFGGAGGASSGADWLSSLFGGSGGAASAAGDLGDLSDLAFLA